MDMISEMDVSSEDYSVITEKLKELWRPVPAEACGRKNQDKGEGYDHRKIPENPENNGKTFIKKMETSSPMNTCSRDREQYATPLVNALKEYVDKKRKRLAFSRA